MQKTYIEALPGAWTRLSVMSKDDGTTMSAFNGELSKTELRGHLVRLGASRDRLIELEVDTYYVDDKINEAKGLLEAMTTAGIDTVTYLPAKLDTLADNLKRRATDILMRDDLMNSGEIDQFVIDRARTRYNNMVVTVATLGSKKTALAEIDAIALHLGLE